jgi:hypothetical protein
MHKIKRKSSYPSYPSRANTRTQPKHDSAYLVVEFLHVPEEFHSRSDKKFVQKTNPSTSSGNFRFFHTFCTEITPQLLSLHGGLPNQFSHTLALLVCMLNVHVYFRRTLRTHMPKSKTQYYKAKKMHHKQLNQAKLKVFDKLVENARRYGNRNDGNVTFVFGNVNNGNQVHGFFLIYSLCLCICMLVV